MYLCIYIYAMWYNTYYIVMYVDLDDADSRRAARDSERIKQLEATVARLESHLVRPPQPAAAPPTAVDTKQLERERSSSDTFMRHMHMFKDLMTMMRPVCTPSIQSNPPPAAPDTEARFTLETMERLASMFK